MMSKNPNMEQGGTSRLVIRPPQVERLGTRRSAFVNFSTICKQYVLFSLAPSHAPVVRTCQLRALTADVVYSATLCKQCRERVVSSCFSVARIPTFFVYLRVCPSERTRFAGSGSRGSADAQFPSCFLRIAPSLHGAQEGIVCEVTALS